MKRKLKQYLTINTRNLDSVKEPQTPLLKDTHTFLNPQWKAIKEDYSPDKDFSPYNSERDHLGRLLSSNVKRRAFSVRRAQTSYN